MAELAREGWGWPLSALKPHYFVNGESLCHRHTFGYASLLVAGPGRGALDCSECQEKLRKRGVPEPEPQSEATH